MALSQDQRAQTERRIRAAIDRLLAGQIPAGGACDVKTPARETGISRASLYQTWSHLKDEFEKRRAAAWAAGQQPDPREARIARLRDQNQRLTHKLAGIGRCRDLAADKGGDDEGPPLTERGTFTRREQGNG
ncbi:hypothetical protein ACWENO_19840 [Streptomyces sp. NPDC004436]